MISDFEDEDICLFCTERELPRCICIWEQSLTRMIKVAVEAGVSNYVKKQEKKKKKAGKKSAPKKKLTTTHTKPTAETGKGSEEEDTAT